MRGEEEGGFLVPFCLSSLHATTTTRRRRLLLPAPPLPSIWTQRGGTTLNTKAQGRGDEGVGEGRAQRGERQLFGCVDTTPSAFIYLLSGLYRYDAQGRCTRGRKGGRLGRFYSWGEEARLGQVSSRRCFTPPHSHTQTLPPSLPPSITYFDRCVSLLLKANRSRNSQNHQKVRSNTMAVDACMLYPDRPLSLLQPPSLFLFLLLLYQGLVLGRRRSLLLLARRRRRNEIRTIQMN